jgi:hypothetical protein
MKIAFLLLFLCGCSPEDSVQLRQTLTDTNSPGFTQIDYTEARGFGYQVTVTTITNAGHRFAVAQSAGHVSICEVTDASLVEANK